MFISFIRLQFSGGLTAVLRKIGRILHISPGRKAVIKTSKPPRIGEILFDINRKPVGKVSDVFGPISSPYIEIDVRNVEISSLVGKMLYQLPSKWKKRSRKRK